MLYYLGIRESRIINSNWNIFTSFNLHSQLFLSCVEFVNVSCINEQDQPAP